MKVRELKEFLKRATDTDKVVLQIKTPYTTIGQVPTVEIIGANSGFDWERGLFLLQSEFAVCQVDPEIHDTMKKLQDRVGWLEYEKRGLTAQINKMKKEIKNENDQSSAYSTAPKGSGDK